jgi:hypothetical protein
MFRRLKKAVERPRKWWGERPLGLYEAASIWIATPLASYYSFLYVQQAIAQPAAEVFPIGIASFGILAGLSGICFTMVPSYPDSWIPKYSGEKFLHGSLLIIQTLFLVYAREALSGYSWTSSWPPLSSIIRNTIASLLYLVTTAALWTWYHGFEELNKLLWKKWEEGVHLRNMQQIASRNARAALKGRPEQAGGSEQPASDGSVDEPNPS